MGMGTNILIFTVLFAFGLQIYCTSSDATCPYRKNYKNLLGSVSSNIVDMLTSSSSYMGIVGLGVAIVGTVVFPNPYLIFIGFSIGLMGFVNAGGVLGAVMGTSGMPDPIAGLFNGILTIAFVLAVWAWYAGRDVP
jgi:hypothetical protein